MNKSMSILWTDTETQDICFKIFKNMAIHYSFFFPLVYVKMYRLILIYQFLIYHVQNMWNDTITYISYTHFNIQIPNIYIKFCSSARQNMLEKYNGMSKKKKNCNAAFTWKVHQLDEIYVWHRKTMICCSQMKNKTQRYAISFVL